jgi:hypothetical protein
VRSWRRAAARRRRKKQHRCTSCGERIFVHEPRLELEHATAPGRLHFHEGEACGLDPFRALVAGAPGAWKITHRRVNAEAN